MSRLQSISLATLSEHNSESSCWIAIEGTVYDVTKFLKTHPGGSHILLKFGGKDATSEYYDFHAKDVLERFGPRLPKVGFLHNGSGDSVGNVPIHEKFLEARGELDLTTPFAEASAFRGWKSPYMQPRHVEIKKDVRRKIFDEILPLCGDCAARDEDPSKDVFLAMGKLGLLAARMGPAAIPFAKQLVDAKLITLPGGIAPAEIDYFTRYIVNNEFYGMMPSGLSDGLCAGINIGFPPILYFGSDAIKAKYAPPVLLGEKRICLAISEPSAGSDVANIMTTAVLSPDKTHYIVNGIKKWITGGTVADVFVTAVRTGKKGHNGLSFLVIDRSEGLTTSKIKTSYSGSASTALVVFENVKVPVENLLGKENSAFKMIMANFNHERWLIVHCFLGPVRQVVADCYRWAMHRKAFGKRLVDQPVIRYKLAEMTAIVESLESWAEAITYQMEHMNFKQQAIELAGPIALLKFHTTRSCVVIADHACQIFGGRAITKSGMGKRIEEFQRCYKIPAIYGGSEEIMADVAVRQAVAILDAHIASGNTNALRMSRL